MTVRAGLPTPSPPDNHREAVTFLLLFLLAFLPYVNTLFNDFVYDDYFQVVENPYVHSFRFLRQIFTTTVWSFQGAQGATNYFRPFMTLGYLLTYKIAGPIPFGFHFANLVLNGIAVLLAFYLLLRFSGERVALIAAGLFALHPVHTESVAWIAAVTDLELTVFYLAAFLLFLKLPDASHKWRARAIMCAVFTLALLSKEQAMTLPVLAVIFEHFYRDDRVTTTPWEKISRYAPLWAMAALYFGARSVVMGGVTSIVLRPNLSWYHAGLSGIALVGQYLGKLIWPAHLSMFYVFHASEHLTDSAVLLGLASLLLCVILFAELWRRAHLLSFALLWIFLTLGPVLNARWMPASVFGERYLYLPSVGFCWLVASAAVKFWSGDAPGLHRPLARAIPAMLAVVALLYAVKTVRRNREWRSDEVLYRITLATQGDSPQMRDNLGGILYDQGDLAGAEREWLEALSLANSNPNALDNMALLRQHEQRYDESIDYSLRALRSNPVYMIEHVHLGETLALVGRAAEAEWQFRVATTLSPLSTRAHNSYGKFLFDAGRLEDARAEFGRSVAVDSTSQAYDRLGDIYLGWRDAPRAELAFRHAIAMDPFDSHAHIGMGQVLESSGHPGDALHEYETGLETNPLDTLAKAAVVRLRAASPGNSIPR
jgi:Tfp pilus assembly protein PilF